MPRLSVISATLAVWLLLATVLLVYLLFSGSYAALETSNERSLTNAASKWQRTSGRAGSLQDDETRSGGEAGIEERLRTILREGGKRADFELVVALSALLPPIQNVSKMPTPSREVFLDYIAPSGLPVVFTDMLVGTKLENWSWRMVRERWGEHVYRNIRQGDFSTKVNKFGKHLVNRVDVKLKDFIDVVTGARQGGEEEQGLYIAKKTLFPQAELEKEFFYPPFYPGDHKTCFLEPSGWLGAEGTYTQGHIDSKDNFIYQLIGKKRWTLFPPADYKYLYYKREKGSLEWSAVLSYPGEKELKDFPLFVKTHPVSVVLKEGEVLYLPRGWTHFVENLTPALMINTWRRGPPAITALWLPEKMEEIKQLCY